MLENGYNPRQVLSKAWLKVNPNVNEFEDFKNNLRHLLSSINESESEEHLKNKIADFLKDTWYKPHFEINTKGRNDLVIHLGKTAKEPVGVIFEVKRPGSNEMVKRHDLNKKAMQELLLYYLQERIEHKNNNLCYFIITNAFEWFIFSANDFEKLFHQNKELLKEYNSWKHGKKVSSDTNLFYNEIAKPAIAALEAQIPFTWFDIKDLKAHLPNKSKDTEKQYLPIYKILSPQHLLKQPFLNDSNYLNSKFYTELLHIIGLVEEKEGSKKVIQRKPTGKRDEGSLIENTINILKTEDRLRHVSNIAGYGDSEEEQLFNIALELCLTWVNRVLFLKLLEAQLIRYHRKEQSFRFVDFQTIPQFDELNKLFFQVLAIKPSERKPQIQQRYGHVPYLNSSLFEITELEDATVRISNLDDGSQIPLSTSTVLTDHAGKSLSKSGESRNTLRYLLDFLDAFDFASEGEEGVREDKKDLINASVLGLIFEKINGYRDGSFFTPGFITMFMCRETLRKAVLQKFNEHYGWNCPEFDHLKDYIRITDRDARQEANALINSLRICDPAVGSGHFLVSALNELISIKCDLEILSYRDGSRIQKWKVTIDNDELNINNTEDESPFQYQLNVNNRPIEELQNLQEALFHEKQSIIEQCLFGADVNVNSVKICRLRLWIELLKNAYYSKDSGYTDLETLPNIDINIKHGNSLISRFKLDEGLGKALKSIKYSIKDYTYFVEQYKHSGNKEEKKGFEKLIDQIQSDFKTDLSQNSKEYKDLFDLKKELYLKYEKSQLFGDSLTPEQIKDREKLANKVDTANAKVEEIKSNKIYLNALEWRFAFPEVLDEKGDYLGFDVVIGNPPYIGLQKMGEMSVALGKQGYETFERTGDIYSLFYERGIQLLKPNGLLTYITSNKWMRAAYGASLRSFFTQQTNPIALIDFGGNQIFDSATVDTNILTLVKQPNTNSLYTCTLKEKPNSRFNLSDYFRQNCSPSTFESDNNWVVMSSIESNIKAKIEAIGKPLKDWDVNIYRGILTGYNEAFIIDSETRERLIKTSPNSDEIIRPILRGRDIKKYGQLNQNEWIILIPNGWTNENRKAEKAEDFFQATFPSIYDYFIAVSTKPTKGKGLFNRDDQGQYWWELRPCDYLEEFRRGKVLYIDIMTDNEMEGYPFPCFSFDPNGSLVLNTSYFMTGDLEKIKFILAFLNSKVGKFIVRNYVTPLQKRQYRMFYQFVKQFPIPEIEMGLIKNIAEIVDRIIGTNADNFNTVELEDKIFNFMVKIIGLNNEEVSYLRNLE